MKKMHYIRPEIRVVTIPFKKHIMLIASPFTEGETIGGGGASDVPDDDWNDEEGL